MPIERLSGPETRPVTVGQLNRVIDELNGSMGALLGDLAALARVSKGVITDSSGGTAVNEVAAVPAAYSEAYFEATLATMLRRINDLVRVMTRLAAYAG